MKRGGTLKRTELKANPDTTRAFIDRGRASTSTKRRPVSPASTEQRKVIHGRSCIVCGATPCHPAHLIDRGMCPEGADDRRAVIPLCPEHHREYDLHRLDVLPYLEPHLREELAFAVLRFGLISTLERVTGLTWRAA